MNHVINSRPYVVSRAVAWALISFSNVSSSSTSCSWSPGLGRRSNAPTLLHRDHGHDDTHTFPTHTHDELPHLHPRPRRRLRPALAVPHRPSGDEVPAAHPIAYDKDKDGVEGFYPPAPVNGQGQLIYIQEGCNQCHTQMIRPVQLGLDGWYKGWGQDQEARPTPPVAATRCVTTSAKNTPCSASSASARTSPTSAGVPRMKPRFISISTPRVPCMTGARCPLTRTSTSAENPRPRFRTCAEAARRNSPACRLRSRPDA
jgi:hypothetical protein